LHQVAAAFVLAWFFLCPLRAAAQALSINQTPYDEAVTILDLEPITFEAVAERRLDPVLILDGVTAGGWLSGQTVLVKTGGGKDNHTVLDRRRPDVPLNLDKSPGPARGAIVFDGAFRSFAMAGIGPEPTYGRTALGTGILTLLFDEPQCLIGLRTWLDPFRWGPDPRSYPEGNLNLIFWNRQGRVIGEIWRFNDFGAQSYAFIQSSGSDPQIMALTIQNLDPEGIGVDDLIFSPLCPYLVGQGPRFTPMDISSLRQGRG
jgi:hypothetical protein